MRPAGVPPRGRKMNKQTLQMVARLCEAGISDDDAWYLRRISMTLHRWHELECGDSNDYASWCITRGHRRESGLFEHDEDGESFLERHVHSENRPRYERIPDRERGAMRRLAKIMARYPGFASYVQGDPRGAALYILRPGDVPEGADVSAHYNHGIAVYR